MMKKDGTIVIKEKTSPSGLGQITGKASGDMV
jgi:hypothetical protein